MLFRSVMTQRGTKQVCLCLARVGVAQCGRQVHPDQTKAVKGQDCKTLATAGAIKRPLSCPREEVGKTEHILQSEKKKKKTEQEEKKKDKNEKQRRKERKLRKKKES